MSMELLTIVYLLSAIVVAIFLYSKWIYSYWKRLGLDYLEPEFPYGNYKYFFKRNLSFGDQLVNIYKELKSRGLQHGGCFQFLTPVYVPIDLEVVKCILQKDFAHFMNHGLYINERDDPLTGHLFNLEDEKWKRLRIKLTPTFTSGKMKMMFQCLVSCAEGLGDILKENSIIQEAVDIKEVLSCFTTDVIGSVAFGIDCNSLKNPDSEFRQWGRKIFTSDFYRRIKRMIGMTIPRDILIKLGFKLTSRDIEEFFMNVVNKTVQYRESNNVYRKDFMQLLLQLKNMGEVTDDGNIVQKGVEKSGERLTLNEVAAQCFVFFIAGFETSATTMTFALLELALNLNIQENLRREINTVLKKHEGEVTYDAVMEMSYLDKVIHETLRKHSPASFLMRACKKPYRVPGTNVILKAGTTVQIPVMAIHRDPEHYPDPEKFDPERFNEENKGKRHPMAFLPFGEGPRICIGARFGILQSKVGLISILKGFKVTLNEKTKLPIKYSIKSPISSVDGDVWINIAEIE